MLGAKVLLIVSSDDIDAPVVYAISSGTKTMSHFEERQWKNLNNSITI